MSQAPTPAQFDPSAKHQQFPKLRPVRGFPAQVGDQTLLGLADARQISDKMVAVPMAAQAVLPLLNGERSLAAIVAEVGRGLTEDHLKHMVAQLDDAGLLFGPRFEAMLADMRREFDSSEVLPPAATLAIAESLVVQKLGESVSPEQKAEMAPALLREAMDGWIAATLEKEANPSFDTLPKAVMVPHIDYPRGWMNYAAVWGRMRVVDRPDRVVILGTNHFGLGTGVTACDKGYETPLGTTKSDHRLLAALKARLGPENAEKLVANRYDHEREHSIELQIAWIQHCLGKDAAGEFCPVLGVLVHDPAVNNGESYDGTGLALQPFIDALKGALADVGGQTLIVSSADLSHCGPMFGDQNPLAGDGEAAVNDRNKVVEHDKEMLNHISQNRPDDLLTAITWQQNPTRWCSVGNIIATMKVAQPERVQLLRYMAALDQQGMGMVSSAAAAMW